MHSRSRLAGVAALSAAALAAAPVAFSKPGFGGNVCGLLTTAQVGAVTGGPAKCVNAKPSPGPGSTIYVGNWAGATPKSPGLQVTVAVYSDPGALKLATSNLRQGLPGPPKPVAGIGAGAYEAKGAMGAGIHTAVGKDVVYVNLTTVGTTPKSAAVLEPLAKAVVAHLA